LSIVKDENSAMPVLGRQTAIALATVAIGVLALIFRTGLLDRAPEFDELYHLLAAQGWLETGRPAILDGEYVRTFWFTRAVAWIFEVTGSASLETGRLLPVVAGALVPPILFLWLRAHAGWATALIGAALAILWPQGIEEAQTLRFYSWQVLTFLVGAIAVFEAVEQRGTRRVVWAILSLASLAIALYLQINTAIGIVAILAWVGLAGVLPSVWAHPARWALLGGLTAAGLVALALLAWSGVLAEAWTTYRWSAGWADAHQDNPTYYHFYLLRTYPVFWPLFPVAALLAFRWQPRMAAFCCLVFGVIFVGQSFGGMKSMRYLSFGMPFFFAILAVALAGVAPSARAALRSAADHLNPTRLRWVSAGVLVVAGLWVALANPFVEISLKALLGRARFGPPETDWSRMDDLLGDWAGVPFRMTMRELHTIDALGDYDVLLDKSRLTEIGENSEFSIDPRTGRPVVGEPASVERILDCEPEGVLLAERAWWEAQGWGIALLPLLDAEGREVETRDSRSLIAIRWSGGQAAPANCRDLPF
jgi:hypothetical protein